MREDVKDVMYSVIGWDLAVLPTSSQPWMYNIAEPFDLIKATDTSNQTSSYMVTIWVHLTKQMQINKNQSRIFHKHQSTYYSEHLQEVLVRLKYRISTLFI